MSSMKKRELLFSSTEESPSLPATPAWKLELINKKKKSVTSASFSHFDRSRKVTDVGPKGSSLTSPTKTNCRWFNKFRNFYIESIIYVSF